MKDLRIQSVPFDDFTMDYCRFGHGPKPLVILPGLSVQSVMPSAEAIAEAYRPLTEDFTLYVFDKRSPMPAAYSLSQMASDTVKAIRGLELGPVSMFGASQGGMIAMEIAIKHPALVEKLILGSTSARVTPDQFRRISFWIQLAEAQRIEELYLAFGEAVYPRAVFEQFRAFWLDAAKTVTPEDRQRFIISAQAIRGFNVLDDLKNIRCPVLVIGSGDDPIFGAAASGQIAEQLKGHTECELFLYEGFGHAAYDTAPDYKERMRRFLCPGPGT